MRANIRTLALGALAALGLSVGAARAADLEEIAAFALNLCDAVNATGITSSSADHCMKFSGEFTFEKHFEWSGGNFYSDGYTSLDLLIEVMGDSDFGVTRGWLDLEFCLDSENCYDVLGRQSEFLAIDEIGISIGNTTVLATGSGATIWNDGEAETLTHLLTNEVYDAVADQTGGVYVSLTHDLGNGWSVAKAIECIDSCGAPIAFIGVVSYDNDGVVGHLSVLFSDVGGFGYQALHAGIEAELGNITMQGAFTHVPGYWEATGSILATLDMVELAGGFEYESSGFWYAIFSAQFDAGEFTIAKAIRFDSSGDWQFASELSTDLSDNLTFIADFELDNFGGWEVGKELEWAPGGGYEASTRAWFRSDGMGDRFGIDSEVTLEF